MALVVDLHGSSKEVWKKNLSWPPIMILVLEHKGKGTDLKLPGSKMPWRPHSLLLDHEEDEINRGEEEGWSFGEPYLGDARTRSDLCLPRSNSRRLCLVGFWAFSVGGGWLWMKVEGEMGGGDEERWTRSCFIARRPLRNP